MRSSSIIMSYFVIGVVMLGGGELNLDQLGPIGFFADVGSDGGVSTAGNLLANINDAGGSLEAVATVFTGTILLIWQLVSGILAFIHWPILVLNAHNAPPIAVLLLGGGFVGAFYMSVIRLFRVSA